MQYRHQHCVRAERTQHAPSPVCKRDCWRISFCPNLRLIATLLLALSFVERLLQVLLDGGATSGSNLPLIPFGGRISAVIECVATQYIRVSGELEDGKRPSRSLLLSFHMLRLSSS